MKRRQGAAKGQPAKREAATHAPSRALSLSPRRRRILIVVSIFVASFVLGTLWYRAHRPAAAGDYRDYLDLAFGLLEFDKFGHPEPTALRLPAYPAFLAVLLSITFSYLWVDLWNIALTASMGVLIYFLTLRLSRGNERTATLAGFLCAASPTFVFFAPIYASEHLFAPLLIGALLLLAAARPPPAVRALLSGAMFGLAMLTRGEGGFYLPVGLLLILATSRGSRQKVLLSACLVSACLVVIAPWYVRNRIVMGSSVGLSTYGGVNFYYAHNEQKYGWFPIEHSPLDSLDEVERHHEGFRRGLSYLRERPSQLASDIATGTRELYTVGDVEIVRTSLWVPAQNSASGIPFRRNYPRGALGLLANYFAAALVLAGASAVFWRRYPLPAWLVPVGILIMNWFCHAVVFWGKPRFRFTSEAFLYILAAIALSELSRWRWRPGKARRL